MSVFVARPELFGLKGTPLWSKGLKHKMSISYIDLLGRFKQIDMQKIEKKYNQLQRFSILHHFSQFKYLFWKYEVIE
jgi:hypothetical protein